MPVASAHAQRLVALPLAAAAVAAGLLVAASTLESVASNLWAGPVADFWRFVPLLEALERGEPILAGLVESHAGHRLLFPRLLYLAEYRLFGGTNAFLVACGALIQGAVALSLARLAWVERDGLSRPAAAFLAGAAPSLLFCATQIDNFSHAWNLHWFLAFGGLHAALLALLAARRAADRPRVAGAWLAACVAAAAVSTGSMALGLLTWPVLVGTGFGLRLPRRWLLLLAGAGLALGGAFFIGYQPPRGAALEIWRRPLDGGLATAALLGAPLSWRQLPAGRLVGALGLLAAAGAWGRFLVRRPPTRDLEALALGLALFAAGSCAMTVAGRMLYTNHVWEEGRYQTAGLYFWLALLALGLARGSGRGRLAPMALAAVGLAGVLIPAHLRGLAESRAFAARVHAAHWAIVAGIEHRPSYWVSLPFRDRRSGRDSVARYAPFLRERSLGMFVGGAHRLLGRPLDDELAPAAEPCPGRTTGAEWIADRAVRGVRLSGWLADGPGLGGGRVLVTGPSGDVLGVGALAGAGSGGARRPWVAFARPVPPGSRLRAWARLGRNGACAIPPPVALGAAPEAP